MSISGKEQYRKWLKTSYRWETARLESLGFDQMKCQGCEKIDPKNHAHHIYYPKTWNETTRRHLRVLCKRCHELIHERTAPNLYKTKQEARWKFFTAINEIRESNNLPPLDHPNHTLEGSLRRDKAIANRAVNLKPIYGDELGVL